MSSCRRGSLGYRGVREHPSGTFYAEIRSDDMRLGLSTFGTAQEAADACNWAAWYFNRPRRDMNFPEVMTREWAQRLAPPPRVVTEEDLRQNRRRERRLGITEMDEHAMMTWRQQFLHDVLDERAVFAQRRVAKWLHRYQTMVSAKITDYEEWASFRLAPAELDRPDMYVCSASRAVTTER
ncbi:Ethylene-responsive transcription factor CRF1 [Hordeum vulgare]|nr:Ethylene-responsive transcription factor CRF1 [Hordeum vulgare]